MPSPLHHACLQLDPDDPACHKPDDHLLGYVDRFGKLPPFVVIDPN